MRIIILLLSIIFVSCDSIKVVDYRHSLELDEHKNNFERCIEGKGQLAMQFHIYRAKESVTLFTSKYYGYFSKAYPYEIKATGFTRYDMKCIYSELEKIQFKMSNHIHELEMIYQEFNF